MGAAELKVPRKLGSTWIIPEDADRPAGARIKADEYIKKRDEEAVNKWQFQLI